jgi:Mrp family chromosome partitioning ATPase/capsular polysaccharide biosynthesis protein
MHPQKTDVRERLEPFRRRWLLIVCIVIAISALTYYHYERQPAQYVASTNVFVQAPGSSSTPVPGTDQETDPARRLQNAAALLQTPAVASKVAQELHYSGDPRDLIGQIAVTPSSNSDFLTISASSSDPKQSAALVNGFSDAFVTLRAQQTAAAVASAETNIQNQLSKLRPTAANASLESILQSQLQNLRLSAATAGTYTRVDPATVPTANSAPSPTRNAIFAAVLGLVLALVLVQGIEAFNRRLGHRMVETEYGLPLLASIPYSRKAHGATRSGSRLPVPLMERVRGLRTMLEHGAESGLAPRTVLVTSAIPGEGKSTLVKSLAVAYFESAKSVLVIDADLRRPMLHEFFEAPLVPGLSDVLRSSISLLDASQELQPGDIEPALDPVVAGSESQLAAASDGEPRRLRTAIEAPPATSKVFAHPVIHLLSAGSGTSDPAALLGSTRLKTLLAEASAMYDLVLIDSPPVLSVSDAIPLATAVDAVVLVARSEFTTRDAALRCRQALERVPTVRVLGVVANAVRDDDELGRPYYQTTSS